MVVELAPTPDAASARPLPPLCPPRPGVPEDSDRLHAGLCISPGDPPRDRVPWVPPWKLWAARLETRRQWGVALGRDPVFAAAARAHLARLDPTRRWAREWDPVTLWALLLTPT